MKILEKFKHVILDCDGVLWHGNELIAGSVEAVNRLKQAGIDVLFVTNNATKTRTTYVEKFTKLGFSGVAKDDVISSGSAAAQFCKNQGFKSAFVIGEAGLVEELTACNVSVVQESGTDLLGEAEFAKIKIDPVDAVVVGWDKRFDYRKLCFASLHLQAGAKLVACNPDSNDVVGDRRMPGNGCALAALQTSVDDPTGEQTIITGKPSSVLATQVVKQYGFDPTATLMVGDRLDTDIAFAGHGGFSSLLVLTGCTGIEAAKAATGPRAPTLISSSLAHALDEDHDES